MEFKLSEQGVSIQHDPKVTEYLLQYELPSPPNVRYGFVRFSSSQEKYRVQLFGQAWLPNHSVGTILFIHGYSEHTGNYGKLMHEFVNANFGVASLDLRGHGLSEGARGHTDTPTAYAEDVEQFLSILFPHLTPHRPLFLWAHSMGGLIALQVLDRKKLPIAPTAVCLTSPLLGFPPLHGLQKTLAKIAPLVAKFFPVLQIPHDLQPSNLSHDEAYLAKRAKDPLMITNTTPKWFLCVKEVVESMQAKASQFVELAPTMLFLAGQEKITNLTEARKFAFHAYASLKHKVIEFPGMHHELEKEPAVRARLVSESLAWFKSKI